MMLFFRMRKPHFIHTRKKNQLNEYFAYTVACVFLCVSVINKKIENFLFCWRSNLKIGLISIRAQNLNEKKIPNNRNELFFKTSEFW